MNCAVSHTNANQATTLAIAVTELYFPIVTLLTQVNAKLLQQLKSGFKRKMNWNKYQSKITAQAVKLIFELLN